MKKSLRNKSLRKRSSKKSLKKHNKKSTSFIKELVKLPTSPIRKFEKTNCIFCFKQVNKIDLLNHQKNDIFCLQKRKDISFNQGLSLAIHNIELNDGGSSPPGSPEDTPIRSKKQRRRIIDSPDSPDYTPIIRSGRRKRIGSPYSSPVVSNKSKKALLNSIVTYNANNLRKILNNNIKHSITNFSLSNLKKVSTKKSASPVVSRNLMFGSPAKKKSSPIVINLISPSSSPAKKVLLDKNGNRKITQDKIECKYCKSAITANGWKTHIRSKKCQRKKQALSSPTLISPNLQRRRNSLLIRTSSSIKKKSSPTTSPSFRPFYNPVFPTSPSSSTKRRLYSPTSPSYSPTIPSYNPTITSPLSPYYSVTSPVMRNLSPSVVRSTLYRNPQANPQPLPSNPQPQPQQQPQYDKHGNQYTPNLGFIICQFCNSIVSSSGWKTHKKSLKCQNSQLRSSQKIKRARSVRINVPNPISTAKASPTQRIPSRTFPQTIATQSQRIPKVAPRYDFDPPTPLKEITVAMPSYNVKYERLPKTDPEFLNIEQLVKNDRHATLSIMSNSNTKKRRVGEITKIVKIDNPMLMERFDNKFGQILMELQDPDACRVVPLFHGTKLVAIKPIAEGGYLGRLNTTSRYGRGTYFSPSANVVSDYAHRGPDNIGVIFLNQVILGITKDTTNDRNRYFSSLIQNRPQIIPNKRPGSPAGHTGGNPHISTPGFAGSVFVVPDDDMAVPTYIIFFKFRN